MIDDDLMEAEEICDLCGDATRDCAPVPNGQLPPLRTRSG